MSFTDSCEWFTIATSYLRVIYGNIIPWTLVRRSLTCQKTCLSFHGSSRVSASCAELFTDTSELLTDACSVTTRKKNPCMWTPCKLITDVVRHLYLWYKSSWLPDTAWALWDRDGRRVGLHQGSAVDSDVGRNTSSPGRFWRPLNSRHSRDPLAYIDQTSFVHSALSPSVLAALGRDSWR